MKEYQKIETLYEFDGTTHKFKNKFRNPIVEYLKDCPWLASEKIDGTNIRVHYDGHKVEWSGRTDKSQLPKEVEAVLHETFGSSEVAFEQSFGNKDVFLFMEAYGGKVQGGLYGGSERLIGFDVMVDGTYLDRHIIKGIFDNFGVECVEMFELPSLKSAIEYVETHTATSAHSEKEGTQIEGLVCVPSVRLLDSRGNRIIVKIKKKDLANMEESK